MVLQEVESPDISAMLGAVSAVQQVWYDFKDVLAGASRKGHHDCKKAQTFTFCLRPANATSIEEKHAVMVGTTLRSWSINQEKWQRSSAG